MMRCEQRRFLISPERIGFLRFIFEGYDGLGIVSTIDRKSGEVVVRFPKECASDVQKLLADITSKISLRELTQCDI